VSEGRERRQPGSWEHGAKKFGEVFVGSFVGNFVDSGQFTQELVLSIPGSKFTRW
jgi:hypothetical protein